MDDEFHREVKWVVRPRDQTWQAMRTLLSHVQEQAGRLYKRVGVRVDLDATDGSEFHRKSIDEALAVLEEYSVDPKSLWFWVDDEDRITSPLSWRAVVYFTDHTIDIEISGSDRIAVDGHRAELERWVGRQSLTTSPTPSAVSGTSGPASAPSPTVLTAVPAAPQRRAPSDRVGGAPAPVVPARSSPVRKVLNHNWTVTIVGGLVVVVVGAVLLKLLLLGP